MNGERGSAGPVVEVAYEGDYAVLHVTDNAVTCSIQFNSVTDLTELENRIYAVILRWQEREANMPGSSSSAGGGRDA